MSVGDYIILAAIAAVIFLSVRSSFRRRKKGCCSCCSCSHCDRCGKY